MNSFSRESKNKKNRREFLRTEWSRGSRNLGYSFLRVVHPR